MSKAPGAFIVVILALAGSAPSAVGQTGKLTADGQPDIQGVWSIHQQKQIPGRRRKSPPHRAVHQDGSGHSPLRIHGRWSDGVHKALEGPGADDRQQRPPLWARLPWRQLWFVWNSRRRESGRTRSVSL